MNGYAECPSARDSSRARPRPRRRRPRRRSCIDLRPPEDYRGRSHSRRGAPRSLGCGPHRHRSGAAEGVHVDDRAPACSPAASTRQTPGRRLRRAVRDPRRARVLVPRVLRPSVACRCSTAGSVRGSRAGLPVTRDAAPPPNERVDRRAAGAARSPPGATSRARSAAPTS